MVADRRPGNMNSVNSDVTQPASSRGRYYDPTLDGGRDLPLATNIIDPRDTGAGTETTIAPQQTPTFSGVSYLFTASTAPATFGAPTDEQGSMELRGGGLAGAGNGKQPMNTGEHGGCTPCRQNNVDCIYKTNLKASFRSRCVACAETKPETECDIREKLKVVQVTQALRCGNCTRLSRVCKILDLTGPRVEMIYLVDGEATSAKRTCTSCSESKVACSFPENPEILLEQSPEE
ncbi:hypothetical protein QFC24_005182 [Naganishia onofrii]|uniref:Uncharacterized protein n=1 Tax=Naganishia onofrii TaxID=1851511 RepID=A0ACC2XAV8_9TREE|nr:hypothetical protein QFC24_005182 [Naganishia onofrii]